MRQLQGLDLVIQASRVSMLINMAIASLIGWQIRSVGRAWRFVLAFVAGAGPTFILRWFWWRANAWTELSALLASGVAATVLQLQRPELLYSYRLVAVVGLSAMVWLPVTYLTAPVAEQRLVEFLRRVRPGSPGWRALAARHGITQDPFVRQATVRWLVGCGVLFGLCFGIGHLAVGSRAFGTASVLLGAGLLLGW